ncbi:17-beta-hydroxysteroid dehydrogenase type 6 isoform X1 [Biomphalaria glabrata]|nr:17-beta-hydroxysteroid dehydrogenase type 6 isoform X1 [Biomphalaria glabrata]
MGQSPTPTEPQADPITTIFYGLTAIILVYLIVDFFMRLLKVGNYGDRYVMVTDCDSAFGQSLVHRLDYLGFHVFAGCLTEDGRIFLSGNCSNRVATFLLDVTKTKRIEAVVQAVRRLLPNSKGTF